MIAVTSFSPCPMPDSVCDSTSTFHLCCSAKRMYMRKTSATNSAASSPPVPARKDPLAGLSGQERRILELIGEGLTNRQIGERMFLAEKTVKNYVSALFAKLGMER